MSFSKITESDYKDKGVVGLPDVPGLTTGEMQRKFDELAKDVAIPAVNKLVEELEAESAADDIGIADDFADFPNEKKKLKSLLVLFAAAIKKNTGSNHAHENKTVLDAITGTVVNAWNGLVSVFNGITGIVTSITGDDTKLPTAGAVSRYVQKMGGGDMSSAMYDDDGDGVVNDSDKLGGQLPAYYQEKTDNTLLTVAKTIVGAINELFNTQPDVLDTLEEIEANTEEGKIAGGLAVKEISGKLGGNILTYNESEDAYYIQYGADSAPKKLGSGSIYIPHWHGMLNGQYNHLRFDTTTFTKMSIGEMDGYSANNLKVQGSNNGDDWSDLYALSWDAGMPELDISDWDYVQIYISGNVAVMFNVYDLRIY